MPVKQKTKDVKVTYVEGIGRRKTSIARVRLINKGSGFMINDKEYREYFPTREMQAIVEEAFLIIKAPDQMVGTVYVSGGGIHSQAEAVRHGISRALAVGSNELRLELKRRKLLTRDPRMKERRKFGLKKARRAPQWSKR